jgi:hypothetical protein
MARDTVRDGGRAELFAQLPQDVRRVVAAKEDDGFVRLLKPVRLKRPCS